MGMLNAVAHQSSMQELDLLNPALDPRITFSRASSKTYFGSNGLLQTAANDVWPLEYDPITLKPIGRSVWEQRTNLHAWSESDATRFSKLGVTTAGTSISGFASSLYFAGDGVLKFAYNAITTSGTTYTISAFVVMDDGLAPVVGTSTSSGDFMFVLGGQANLTFATPKVESLGGSLYRASATFAAGSNAGNNGAVKYATQSLRGFRITGWQLEAGTFASPYIPTAGSQVTRAADIVNFDVSGIRLNSAGMTIATTARAASGIATDQCVAQIDSGSDSQRWLVYRALTGQRARAAMRSSGNPGDAIGSIVAADAKYKMAVAFQQDNLRISSDGSAPTVDITAGMPTGLTTGRIGRNAASAAFTDAPIERIAFYPCLLADSELQAITA